MFMQEHLTKPVLMPTLGRWLDTFDEQYFQQVISFCWMSWDLGHLEDLSTSTNFCRPALD